MADVTEQRTVTNQGETTIQGTLANDSGTVTRTTTPGAQTTDETQGAQKTTKVAKAHEVNTLDTEILPERVTEEKQPETTTTQTSSFSASRKTTESGGAQTVTTREDIGFHIEFTLPMKGGFSTT